MKSVYIYGAGDLAREIANTIDELNEINTDKIYIKGFIIDVNDTEFKPYLLGDILVQDVMSLSKQDWLNNGFIIGIGSGVIRKKIRAKIEEYGGKLFSNIIHPKAYVSLSAEISDGCYIGPNTSIAIACKIKDNVIINQNCSIGHDVELRDNVVISPGTVISGRCQLGDATFVGSGAVILPRITIGEQCIIGANVTVSQDVQASIKLLSVVRNMSLPIEE